jgi:hypothetical protein
MIEGSFFIRLWFRTAKNRDHLLFTNTHRCAEHLSDTPLANPVSGIRQNTRLILLLIIEFFLSHTCISTMVYDAMADYPDKSQ